MSGKSRDLDGGCPKFDSALRVVVPRDETTAAAEGLVAPELC